MNAFTDRSPGQHLHKLIFKLLDSSDMAEFCYLEQVRRADIMKAAMRIAHAAGKLPAIVLEVLGRI